MQWPLPHLRLSFSMPGQVKTLKHALKRKRVCTLCGVQWLSAKMDWAMHTPAPRLWPRLCGLTDASGQVPCHPLHVGRASSTVLFQTFQDSSLKCVQKLCSLNAAQARQRAGVLQTFLCCPPLPPPASQGDPSSVTIHDGDLKGKNNHGPQSKHTAQQDVLPTRGSSPGFSAGAVNHAI